MRLSSFLTLIFSLLFVSKCFSQNSPVDRLKQSSWENNFGFGIEYLQPCPSNLKKVISKFSEIGATWSKFNGPGTRWRDIEPNLPVAGKHVYSWEKVDQRIKMAQAAGFRNLMVVLKSNSPWACKPAESKGILEYFSNLGGTISTPPTNPENFQFYKDYVFSFVERYDGDGTDDMPGLEYPILDFEIETEAQHRVYWQGTIDEYKAILKAAYQTIKKANPAARVILSGFALWDIFDEGYKSQVEIGLAIENLKKNFPITDVRHGFGPKYRSQLEFNESLLGEKDCFDVVEFHLLSNYKAIPGTVRWIKEKMRENGYERPIWIGDGGAVVTPCSNERGFCASWKTYTLFSKAPYRNGDKLFEVLSTKKDADGFKYSDVKKWYEAEQANILVKAYVLAMTEGIRGMNWWTWFDVPALFKTNGAGKSWSLCGLLREDEKPRPAFYSYKLLIRMLDGFEKAERINLKLGIEVFRFSKKDKEIFVAWVDSPDQGFPPSPDFNLSGDFHQIVSNEKMKVTCIVTDENRTEPKVDIQSSIDVPLSQTPVFLEAQ